jgi:hypothetical protein
MSDKKRTDYEQVIRSLSSAYDRRGRAYHDEFFSSLKGEIEDIPYQILKRVVIEEYLDKRGANRLFGAFPEWDINSLMDKCKNLEGIFRESSKEVESSNLLQ